MTRILHTPLDDDTISQLKAGTSVKLSGTLYTARDAAHKRLVDLIRDGRSLPFELRGRIIYYVGPTPARPGYPLGSAGPTTSMRMNSYAPLLIEYGLKGMIGKGEMGHEVAQALRTHHAVYFAAVGGAGALMAQCIHKSRVIAWKELGPEAVRELEVHELPVIVAQDSYGNNLFRDGKLTYRRSF